ncbi:glycosyltransferase family 39 protein [Solirubrobacter soli]|uniref:glycosyltransferase family 39 protein n=1 Tax=Solirubrobacter soli TaxID=363832 RepID=UPI00040240BA|nr:glycosyltransferase family 39 protein [Solirubrobacter soli]
MRGSWYGVAVVAVLLAALGCRVAYVAATPGYTIVDDARDYDMHASSIASGDGFSKRLTGKPTAFRPPGYPYLLGGVYRVFGVEQAADAERIRVARALGVVLGVIGVALIGVLATQLLTRTAGLVAMALAALYVPSILVAAAIMSEQLFVVLMLAALVTAIHQRRSEHRYAFAALAGLLAGLAVLTRANGLILLVPLVIAVWRTPRAVGPAVLLVAVALATVAPWTIRNAVELHAFVPVTTQLGWALAGTYNSEARDDHVNPGSWRSLRRVDEYKPLVANFPTTPEIVMERRLSHAGREFIRRHPGYLVTVAYWNTRRLLDLASLRWSRHTASTISVGPGWAVAGVVCFWVFAALALFGATRRAARQVPWFVWVLPLAMYLSVVFLAAETPRYRAPLDPFVILLAAIAVTSVRMRRHS